MRLTASSYYASRATSARATFSCEELLTDPALFALTTASPLQRAICRVVDGRPLGELADSPGVREAFGDVDGLPSSRVHEMAIISGIRTAKSLIAACIAVFWTQTVDLSRLGPGETARVSVVSIRKDLAQVVFDHVRGRCQESPVLRGLIVGEPKSESIFFRHPGGSVVEIMVASGARAGASLVARWMAGVIFDEFPRMNGVEDGVINWNSSRAAVYARILRGGGIMNIGSPWAPVGPAYEMVRENHGKPSKKLVVVHAPAWVMNPVLWTPEACEDEKQRNPDVYQTDVEAKFATPEEALFSAAELERATLGRAGDLPPDPLLTYRAAMDPATRSNGWTLVVTTRDAKIKIAVAREWRGTRAEPLSPRAVFTEIAELLRPYGVTSIYTDQHLADALRDIAREFGLTLVQIDMPAKEKAARYGSVKTMLGTNELELHPDPSLRADMQRVRKKPLQGGSYAIVLPMTSDGRHCDYAPSVVLAVTSYTPDAKHAATEPGSRAALREEANKLREARFAEVARATRGEQWAPTRMAPPPMWRGRRIA